MDLSSKENEQDIQSIWQTCVEMANIVSQRRDTINNLFVTLNIAIVTVISWIWDIKTAFLCAVGFIICIVWLLYISNLKKLSTAKFQVINNLEQKMGINPFKDEWDILKGTKCYIEGTKLECVLPIAFGIGYIVLFFILFFTI